MVHDTLPVWAQVIPVLGVIDCRAIALPTV